MPRLLPLLSVAVALLAVSTTTICSAQLTLEEAPWDLMYQGDVALAVDPARSALDALGVFSLASSTLDPTDAAAAPQLPDAWQAEVAVEVRDANGAYEFGVYNMAYSEPLAGIRINGTMGSGGASVASGDPMNTDTLWRYDLSVATVRITDSPALGINLPQRAPLTGMPKPPAMVHPDAEFQGTGSIKGVEVDLWTWISPDTATELYYWMLAGTSTPAHWTRLQFAAGNPDPVYQWGWNWRSFSTAAPVEEQFEPTPAMLWKPDFEDDFSAYGELYARQAGSTNPYSYYAVWDWHYAWSLVSNAGILKWVVPNTPVDRHEVLHGDENTFWWEVSDPDTNQTDCTKYYVADPPSAYIPLAMNDNTFFTGFFSACGAPAPCEIWYDGNEIWDVAVTYPDGDSFYAITERIRYTVSTVDYLVDLDWVSGTPAAEKLTVPASCDPTPAVSGVDPVWDGGATRGGPSAQTFSDVLYEIAAELELQEEEE